MLLDPIGIPIPSALLAIGIVLALALGFYVIQEDNHSAFWSSQPWVGLRNDNEWFPRLRASLRTIRDMRAMVEDGYTRFSQRNAAFVLPSVAEAPWVVLPPAAMREMLSKPETDLDANIIHEQQLQTYYAQGPLGHHAATVPVQFELVRRQLTRQLPVVAAAMHDEVDQSFRQYWGTDQAAPTEISLLDTCTKIVTRTANRVFTGADICRDEAVIEHSRRYIEAVGRAGIIIRLLPRWLRPVLAPVVTVWHRRSRAICRAICVPVVRRRVQQTVEKQKDPEHPWEAPTDVLQWLIDAGLHNPDPRELDPLLLTQRLLMLNFVALETTTMALTHAITDLYSSPDAASFVAGLREECDRIFPPDASDERWTKAQLDQLVRLDSTIRESMRVSDFAYIALPRMVVNPSGVDIQTDEQTLHLPPGVRVCMPAHSIHRDPAFHADPTRYNAFRFAEAAPKRASVATTTDSFLVFGHGRHACPGRFFAAQVMKLVLAYLVQHYEVDALEDGVDKQVQVGTARPDARVKLRVRRCR